MNAELKAKINLTRSAIGQIGAGVKSLKKDPSISPTAMGTDLERDAAGEAIANIMLAYRHLEDARMRLGKAIQALEGGESVYDKPDRDPVAKGGVD